MSLMIGNSVRDAVWKQDKALVNTDRVRKLRRKELQELALETPQDIAGFDRTTNANFITESSLRMVDGCIILQTVIMKKILNDSETGSQTDTIEGFVSDPFLPSANLTVTSTFCGVLQKWVPTQFAILFGKSEEHYAIYFYTLLRNMTFGNFQTFVDNYMGMVCDFSDAEKNGFERGLQQRFNVSKGDYPLEKFYAF